MEPAKCAFNDCTRPCDPSSRSTRPFCEFCASNKRIMCFRINCCKEGRYSWRYGGYGLSCNFQCIFRAAPAAQIRTLCKEPNCTLGVDRMGFCEVHFKLNYPNLCCKICYQFPPSNDYCDDCQCAICEKGKWCGQHIRVNHAEIITGYLEVLPLELLQMCFVYL